MTGPNLELAAGAELVANPELVHVVRGGVVESRHRGSLVLLDATGAVQLALGDVTSPVFARSALKPLQTVAMLRAGLDGPSTTVALASASHVGEPVHLTGARATLAAAGLDESALQCPPDLPAHRPSMLRWVRAGRDPAAVCHNCSGKHAAMLATCVTAGWDPATYLQVGHPLQRAVVAEIERLTGAPIGATTVDGCGAPAHAVPLTALARSFARLTTADGNTAERQASDAARAHPHLLGGTGTPVTELAGDTAGLLCKNGAEGVWAAAMPDGRAFAAKIDDGAERALGPLLATVLRHWGGTGSAVRRWEAVPVLGGGRPAGAVVVAPQVRERLTLPPL